MPIAILALGSNLGDAPRLFSDALDHLRREKWWVEDSLLTAPHYTTAPVDCPPDSPDFTNTVIAFWHPGKPTDLLSVTQRIEHMLGRPAEHGHNAPRTIDLDLILHGDDELNTDTFTLPHARFAERRFVLQPLADILPGLIPIGYDVTVRQLLEDLEN